MLIRPARPPIVAPLARPIGEDGSGLGWDGGAGGVAQILNLANLSLGTFTRSTEGSYLTGAPTDGSSAFLAWAGVNVRRIENRGDGLGSMLLMEGSRTASILQSYAFDNVAWTAVGLTATADTNAGPDGLTTADTLAFTASATAQISQPFAAIPADAARAVVTVWLRAAAPQTVRLFIRQKDGVTEGAAVSCSVTTTWQRFELNQAVGAGASAPLLIIRNHSDAAARNVFAILADVECSAALVQAPSSTIRTTAAAVTRGADVLSYAVGQYPASFLTSGFTLTFAPDASSAEVTASGAHMPLFTTAAGAIFRISADCRLHLYKDGSVFVVQTPTATWSRGQLLTCICEPTVGRVTLLGATTGGGASSGPAAPAAWSASAITVGSASTFGRFGLSVVAL